MIRLPAEKNGFLLNARPTHDEIQPNRDDFLTFRFYFGFKMHRNFQEDILMSFSVHRQGQPLNSGKKLKLKGKNMDLKFVC